MRNVGIDHHDGRLIDYGALAERADHAKGADRAAASIAPAIAAVELRPLGDAGPLRTEMVQPAPAPATAPAAGNEGQHHMVADGDP